MLRPTTTTPARACALAFVLGLALAAVALVAPLGAARAAGDTDPARFRLTPALLERMDAVRAELEKLPQTDAGGNGKTGGDADDDSDDDAEASIEDIARKLDAHPQVRATLARHGLNSRQYATAMMAALHAGMVLAVEKAPGPKSTQALTPEQRANVDVLRAYGQKRR